MKIPRLARRAASNFYRGDDAAAKQVGKPLIEQVGFEAIDAGRSRARM